jgi:hypothetical protein
MTDVSALQAPDLPELEEGSLPPAGGSVELSGVRVAGNGEAMAAERVRLRECELRGVVLGPAMRPDSRWPT